MKRLGENQKILLEKLQKDGKIENVGEFYRSISSRKTSNQGLKSFIDYVTTELDYKLELGKRGGLSTAKLYK